MKPLKKVYEDLNVFYASLDKLTKWMSSNRGKEFAKRLGREPLDQLIKRLGAPNIDKKDYIQKLNSYKYAVKQSGLQRRAIIVKDYDKKVKEMKEAGKLKLPPSLTKEDLMKMNTYIVRDADGNAIIKTDDQGRQFWNKFTNKPILVRKRKSSKMGLAQKCHLYELHKMEKWDRKNQAPADQGLSYDLFPKEPLLRLFRVCQFKSQFLPGGFGVYETEATNNYDFTSYTDTYPSNEMIMKKLQYRIMHPDWSAIGTTVVGLKVYDQYGNVRGQLSFIDSLKPIYRSIGAAA